MVPDAVVRHGVPTWIVFAEIVPEVRGEQDFVAYVEARASRVNVLEALRSD